MINITKHALKRYVERFVDPDKASLQDLLSLNKELYEKELIKMFEHSKHIFDGKFNDRQPKTSFHLADDIILVTDTECTKIITLYRVEYGFSKVINKSILNDLLLEREMAEVNYMQIKENRSEEKKSLLYSRDNLDADIKSLEETLKAMKESKNSLDNYITNFNYEETKAKTEIDTLAQKIVYSINYKLEVLKV